MTYLKLKSDEPMTEYELYQYEAFRKHVHDDARIVENASLDVLDRNLVTRYLDRVKYEKPNLAAMENDQILKLMNMVRDGKPTLSAILLFSRYPQSCFPQLCVTGVVVDRYSLDDVVTRDERFVDNARIEGNLQYMIEESMAFVRRNIRKSTVINENTGEREDRTEYPLRAVREAILNALLHRDYSVLTENKPVQIIMYRGRLESQAYAMRRYVAPLIQKGVIRMTDSGTPKARGQRYYVK